MVHLREDNSSLLGDPTTPRTWYNNSTIANSTSALVDGAKRDRLVFAADLVIAMPGIITSTYDLPTVKNSISSLFARQDATTGQLPYVGSPYPFIYYATYHLYTLMCVSLYYLYSVSICWPL